MQPVFIISVNALHNEEYNYSIIVELQKKKITCESVREHFYDWHLRSAVIVISFARADEEN